MLYHLPLATTDVQTIKINCDVIAPSQTTTVCCSSVQFHITVGCEFI